MNSYDYLSDADYEEEVRCAALGLDGPNSKSYRALTWAENADALRKRLKENGDTHSVHVDHLKETP